MRVLVCGGRDFSDRPALFSLLDRLHAHTPITLIIEGGAAGADSLARAWALSRKIQVDTHPADWARYGGRAGNVRNGRMLREGCPDLVVAFAGGAGTRDMVKKVREAGVRLYRFDRHRHRWLSEKPLAV